MLDIILGMFLVLKEAVIDLLNLLFGFIKVLLKKAPKTTKEKKNEENAFKELLARENYLVDTILLLLPFIIVSHYSMVVAPIVTFIFIFILFNKKKLWYNNRDLNLPDESFIFSVITVILIIIATIVYTNINTPYDYEKIGNFSITAKEIENSKKHGNSIEAEINHNIETIDVKDCKEGNYTILKESMNPYWFKVNKVDYYASCSSAIDIKKQLNNVKKIKD